MVLPRTRERDMTREELEAEIDELMTKAETGEQWAEICHLEVMLEEIKRTEAFDNGQFGVGA
jgi:hypothetical protein